MTGITTAGYSEPWRARSICRHERVKLPKAVRDRATVKAGGEVAFLRLNVRHKPNVAVVDFLAIVILDLHDLVAWRESPTKSLDLALARRIQCCLEFNVKRACSDTASVHRAENLDIADWIETKAARDTGFDELDDSRNRDLGIVRLDKIEVALDFGFAKIGYDPVVDTVGIHDDLALGRLTEYFGEAHHRHGSG
jgi:hypothetical protein